MQLGNDSVYNDRRLFNRKQNIDVLKKGKDESHQHLDRETEGTSSKLSGWAYKIEVNGRGYGI